MVAFPEQQRTAGVSMQHTPGMVRLTRMDAEDRPRTGRRELLATPELCVRHSSEGHTAQLTRLACGSSCLLFSGSSRMRWRWLCNMQAVNPKQCSLPVALKKVPQSILGAFAGGGVYFNARLCANHHWPLVIHIYHLTSTPDILYSHILSWPRSSPQVSETVRPRHRSDSY